MDMLFSIIKVLQINEMLGVYLIVFTVMFFFVSKFLMQPYYEKYLARQDRTRGLIEKAKKIQKENEETIKKYEKQLYEFNALFNLHLQKKKTEILETHKKLINETHSQAKVLLEKAKKDFSTQYDRVEKALSQKAPKLARELSLKLLQ